MESISQFMSTDHRRCDELFAVVEESVAVGDWAQSDASFEDFRKGMARHFAMEEEVLFPAFEQHTGNAAGPTQVMRIEHGQMRELIQKMDRAIRQRDAGSCLGEAETLLIMMQQHNMKEEQILYTMMDRAMGGQAPGLLERISRLEE